MWRKTGAYRGPAVPGNFDGVIAGAPSNYMTHQLAQIIWVAQAVHKDEASYIPPEKYSAIHHAVLAACDALDGVKDGLLEDPTRCKFDPIVLECRGSDGPACLTAPQVEAARKIYAPATIRAPSGKSILALCRGANWAGPARLARDLIAIATGYWKYVIFKDPNWDYKTLNFDSDVARADRIDNGTLNATDPNLEAFFARGGRLLHYHGWDDPALSPLNSVSYYKSVSTGPEAGATCVIPIVCSWFPAWPIAGEAKDQTTSTWSVRSSSGLRRGRRRIRSSRLTGPTAKSTERARCALILRLPPTKEPGARTTPRTSPVRL